MASKQTEQSERWRWGTQVMGAPAAPSAHPENQKAALSWPPADHHHQQPPHPYVVQSPVPKSTSVTETALHKFNKWSSKAEALAHNIWLHLKTAPSISEAAWGKVSLTTKAVTEGGFESLFKQTFPSEPSERLKKTFACYLSTSTGPVAGTLYLSNFKIAFCSDRPLSFTAPSGQQEWSYYKVVVPLAKVGQINPVSSSQNAAERYIQIVTIDGHDFWYMGFVSYDKALSHLFETLSEFAASSQQPSPLPQNTS